MLVFRLVRAKYGNKLSGKGAAITGQRWNSKGTELIYTSESRALAFTEVCTYVSLKNFPKDFQLLEIFIPDDIPIKKIDQKDLPDHWNCFPHQYKTQKFGDDFIRTNEYLVMKVPSAIIPGDFNYLINPFHSDFSKVKVHKSYPFPVDERLFS